MVTHLSEEQLANLKSWGFQGEGYLEELIGWLGIDNLKFEYCVIAYVADGTEEWGWELDYDGIDELQFGKTLLEAVWNLCEAINNGKAE